MDFQNFKNQLANIYSSFWDPSNFTENFCKIWAKISSDDDFSPNRREAIIWNDGGSVYRHIHVYASLWVDELNYTNNLWIFFEVDR